MGSRLQSLRGTRLVLCIVIVIVNVMRSEGRQLIVGNQMGWTNYDLKSFQVPNYGKWAISQNVRVGDEVVFRYARGMHNVNLLPNKAAFLSCDFSKARILDGGQSGVYTWRATTAGVFYFGCNKKVEEEGNHCGSGQKFALLVRPQHQQEQHGGLQLASVDAGSNATLLSPAPSPVPMSSASSPTLSGLVIVYTSLLAALVGILAPLLRR